MQGFVEVLGQRLDEIRAVGAYAVDPRGNGPNRQGLHDDPVEDLIDLLWPSA